MQPGSISIQLLEREVEVLKRVKHPCIIQLEAVYETAKVPILLWDGVGAIERGGS
jgi:serine/threonine protein kinase